MIKKKRKTFEILSIKNKVKPYRKALLDKELHEDLKALARVMIESHYYEYGFKKKFKISYSEALKIAADINNPVSDKWAVKVLKWDKRVIGEAWFKTRLLKAECERDTDYLKTIADAIKNTRDNRFSRKSSLDELLPYIKAFETVCDYCNPKEREKIRNAYYCEFKEILKADHPFLIVLIDETAFYKWLKRHHFID